MEPAIRNNNIVYISSLFYIFNKPKINDIVAFKFKDKIFIKRIFKVNNNKIFMVGDNYKDSLDSRKIGSINKKQIVGKVFKIL